MISDLDAVISEYLEQNWSTVLDDFQRQVLTAGLTLAIEDVT